MPRLTILFGVLLLVLGVAYFFLTGSVHKTALLPSLLGVLLVVSGALAAQASNPKGRMVWMHAAVTIGLIGFLGTAARAILALTRAHGGPLPHPLAVQEQFVMAALCLAFVALCVRSFIAARRERQA